MKHKFLLKTMLLLSALIAGSGSAWADSYTITFGNSANSATAISASTQASTTIASASRSYVTSTPYSDITGNCYYGGSSDAEKSSIRIGKSGNNASITIALSDDGKVTATSIVVNCMKMTGNKNANAKLAVNGMDSQAAPASADNLTFTFGSSTDIEDIVLESVTAVYVYSITVNYTTGGGGDTPSSHTLTYSATNGSIYGEDAGNNEVKNGDELAANTEVTLTATPNSGYVFSSWTVSGTGSTLTSRSTNPTTFTMGSADATVTATFVDEDDCLTTMNQIFSAATSAGTTATDCYVTFNNWVVTGVKNNQVFVTDGTKGFVIYQSNHGFSVGNVLNGTVACKVQLYNGFAELTNLTSSTAGLIVTTGGTVSPQVVSINNLSGVNTGALIQLNGVTYDETNNVLEDASNNTITPYTTLYTGSYTDGSIYNVVGVYQQQSSTPHRILPRSAADIVEVVPNPQTLTVSATNGSVEITGKTLDNGSCEVAEGARVEATATPAEHYTFTSWTAEGVTLADATDNPLTFFMPTNDVTLTANFTEDDKYTATFYVQGTGVGTYTNYEGEAITFPSVTAPTGYTFMGWTTSAIDGSQDAAPETLVSSANMGSADVSYYAVFAVGSASGNVVVGTLSGSDITEWDGIAYSDEETTHTLDNITWSVRGNRGSNNPWIQIRSNAIPSYIKITTPGKLSNVSLSISNASNSSGGVNDITKHGDFSGRIYLKTTTSSDKEIVSATATDKAASLDLPENTNYTEVYIVASAAARIWNVDVTYTGSTYSGYCTTVTAVPAKFNASGYATFACSVPLDFSDDSEFSAWQITGVSGSSITFSQIKEAVAAGTGVLLKGTASTPISIPVAASGTDISSTNKLEGITTATTIVANAYYGLSGQTFVKVKAGTVPAGKALLPASVVDDGSSVKAFTFVFEEDDATSIRSIDNGQLTNDNEIYNLAGQRLQKMQKGINIVNGKKVLF